MTTSSATIVQRLWNYCNVLRDDGMSYGDYVEQLTYLLFLKMADAQVRVLGKRGTIPEAYGWPSLLKLDGDALEAHYRTIVPMHYILRLNSSFLKEKECEQLPTIYVYYSRKSPKPKVGRLGRD